jgi:nucleotide-binding universal stress UspA family protein
MYKKILVPTDGSELSEQATVAAVDFARHCNAELVAFAVAEPYLLVPAAEGAMVVDPGIETRVLMEAAQAAADKVARAAKAAGLNCAAHTAFSTSPADEIVNAAKDNGCDLIFMASHGRHGLSRLLMGSVTQRVLAYSPVPVMVLRPGRQDHQAPLPGAGPEAA